jgi:hypothetical protein
MRWLLVIALAATACNQLLGGSDVQRGDGSVPGDGRGADGSTADAVNPGGCTPDTTKRQCSNCIDDDSDGTIDSFDMACTTPNDNDESTFATGIPGDNLDTVTQDCFFDGNSGAGDDGCSIHVCCLLGATSQATCPIAANQYNPGSCPPPIGNVLLSPQCVNFCGKLAPPGCDCFGCCTLCDPTTKVCQNVAVNPATSPGCTPGVISDPSKCLRCTQVPSCGRPTCGGSSCILCPGQTPSDLPASCGGTPSCPAGTASCANDMACPAGTYCHATSQCCVAAVLQ